MAKIDTAEIRLLVARTRAHELRWNAEGRRFLSPGYVLALRANGGPMLSRTDDRGIEQESTRARFGLLPLGRALYALARAVEDQVTAARAERRQGPAPADASPDEAVIDLVSDERAAVGEITPPDEERPGPSPQSPSGRSDASETG